VPSNKSEIDGKSLGWISPFKSWSKVYWIGRPQEKKGRIREKVK
jgi:hypothetical protein